MVVISYMNSQNEQYNFFFTLHTSHRPTKERNQLNIERDKKTRTHAYSSITTATKSVTYNGVNIQSAPE